MSSDREMRAVSSRIEALVAELETLEDVSVRSRVEELVRLLMQLHGEGLARMLALWQQPDFDPSRAVERFAADPVVASVLMLHDLHPHDVRTRIERALDLVRTNLPHGTEVTLLEISNQIVRLRVDAAAGGCGTPADAIRTTVDAAIRDAAPEAREVEVEVAVRTSALPLIQLTRR
jgi:Fe-S cluster biogenesis protein NfuA